MPASTATTRGRGFQGSCVLVCFLRASLTVLLERPESVGISRVLRGFEGLDIVCAISFMGFDRTAG